MAAKVLHVRQHIEVEVIETLEDFDLSRSNAIAAAEQRLIADGLGDKFAFSHIERVNYDRVIVHFEEA